MSTKNKRDEGAAKSWLRALHATAGITTQPSRILPKVVEEIADQLGDAPALLSAGSCLTYRQLSNRINHYARWALVNDIGKMDVVALLVPNCPEYLAIWLGITRIGGTVALLNTNLVGSSLAHCVDIAGAAHIIVAADLLDAFEVARGYLKKSPKVWLQGGDGHFPRIDEDMGKLPAKLEAAGSVTIKDRALLIYTSGTTGLPKAANISHQRIMQWSMWFAGLMNTTPEDRMYDCLPMYHSVGGVVAPGALLVRGGSVVIQPKFSVQQFWTDIANWKCSIFQYIGELCRYLVNAPEHSNEDLHQLRMCCGNGLSADVWERFQRRFAIPRILEFYAATEGNVSLFNVEGKVGAIGRIPSFLAHRLPLVLVKYDAVRQEPQRMENGFCKRCEIDEVGEALGRIKDVCSGTGSEFEGYADEGETERKIVRDVLERGDAWFRTGDLMRIDKGGYFYFVDRIGDTFRWKGENVSTSEVTIAVTAYSGINEAVVYGVDVPNTEGKAGMAVLVVDRAIDLSRFHAHLALLLPRHARPLFLRVKERTAVTATFKHIKNDLLREGFDPTVSDDAIYFDDTTQRNYVRLDQGIYEKILAGRIRL